jgi:CubicO group peptidase (beta-lactamase class C family)
MRRRVACLLLLLSAAPGRADEDPPPVTPRTFDDLDAQLALAFKAGNIPGAAVVVIEENAVVFSRNYGVRDLASKAPVTAETVFRAGSITKTFTSLLAMTWVAEGKLDLDAKLADVAPDLGFDNPWEASAPVRIVNLLEHTSGWRDLTFADVVKQVPDSTGGEVASTRRLRVSRWPPGRSMAYTSVGPGVVGVVLERLGAAPFATQVHDRILAPLGMTNSGLALTPQLEAQLSKSYDHDGVTEIPYHGLGLAAAGSLLTTASDLARLVLFMNARGQTPNGAQLLSPAAIDRMEHPTSTLAAKAGLELGYGLGVFYAPQENFIVFGHNGAIDGFEAAYVYWPAARKGFVLMVNGGTGNDDALALLSRYVGRDYRPSLPSEVAVDPVSFARALGFYRPISQRHPFMNALVDLVPTRVRLDEKGRVQALDSERLATGPSLFRRAERAEPSLVFYETPEGDREMSTGREFYRALSGPEVFARGALVLGAALAFFTTALLLLWRAGRAVRRRRDPQPPASLRQQLLRWAPAASVGSLFATFGPFLVAANAGYQAVERLGHFGFTTATIWFASLLWPTLAIIGLLASIFAPGVTGRGSRIAAAIISSAMTGLALFFFLHGWVGIRLWA